MSYLRSAINLSGEPCDKCNKPMNPEFPGMELHGYTQEQGRVQIWVHLICLKKVIDALQKRALKELVP